MIELLAFVRFLHLAAAVLLVGGFGFLLFVARSACRRADAGADSFYSLLLRRQLRLFRWCLLINFITALLWLWLQSLNVSGSSIGMLVDLGAAVPLLTETQFGKVWLARMVLLLFLAGLVLVAGKRAHANLHAPITIGFVLSIGLLASLALAGHAAAAEGGAFALQASADMLHLSASGIWLGALVPLRTLLRACNRQGASVALMIAGEATRRFSLMALVCVGVLVVSGTYNAWILVGGFPALFGTPYGELLLAKLCLLVPLLGIAAVNLLRHKPAIIDASKARSRDTSIRVRKIMRNVFVEMLLGMAILLIVGHMAVTPPARHVQPEWPFAFRWDWSAIEKAPKARAEVQRGAIWAAVGGIAILCALARRRRRMITTAIGLAALGYAGDIVHTTISIDAYPATYRRPAVTYHAISVANGKALYEASGCAVCHGLYGYGDGPAAQQLIPRPADLTAAHANAHTAGDLFWWLSYGVKKSSAMPGFSRSLSEEERWDLINYLRALSSGEKARSLAPVIEEDPWLVAPDFAYETNNRESRMLTDHRGKKIVLLALLNLADTEERLQQLGEALPQLRSAGVELIVIPRITDLMFVADKLPGAIVTEGIRETTETYQLFARSFADETPDLVTPHVEYLIDKQGYIRARWLPAEGEAWADIAGLMAQTELLRKEQPRAAAPDEHVH